MNKKISAIFLLCFTCPLVATSTTLTSVEKNIIDTINANNSQALHLLENLVNINSGTENLEGVFEVGTQVQKEFEKLGFASEWKFLPEKMDRVGTLLLTRKGTQGKHVLLIAHLDTVFP